MQSLQLPSIYDEYSSWPKITVLTTTLNSQKYVEQALLSVINQQYPALQYIIIDGNSTDDTLKIINQYSSQISMIISEPDHGQGWALNKGLQMANGEIFYSLDSDDILQPWALYYVARCFIEYDIDVVCGFVSLTGLPGKQITVRNSQITNLEDAMFTSEVYQPGTFYRRKILEALGGINPKLDACADMEIWKKYLLKFGTEKLHYLNKTVVQFRIHEDAKMFVNPELFGLEKNMIITGLLTVSGFYSKANDQTEFVHFSNKDIDAVNSRKLRSKSLKYLLNNTAVNIYDVFLNSLRVNGVRFIWYASDAWLHYKLEELAHLQKRFYIFLRAWFHYFYALLLAQVLLLFPSLQKNVPIIINNRNRLTMMSQLIRRLKNMGHKNIYIIDNNSTYPPLVDYYQHTDCKIIRLKENMGHLSLWKTDLFNKFKWTYFIYTDPDVLPLEECPSDFVKYFISILMRHKKLKKVGFSLRIDDLPDHNKHKHDVISSESPFWINQLEQGVYDAPIDTTFALYKPFTDLTAGHTYTVPSARTDYPYSARHLPWYCDSQKLNAEEKYYQKHTNDSTSWTMKC